MAWCRLLHSRFLSDVCGAPDNETGFKHDIQLRNGGLRLELLIAVKRQIRQMARAELKHSCHCAFEMIP